MVCCCGGYDIEIFCRVGNGSNIPITVGSYNDDCELLSTCNAYGLKSECVVEVFIYEVSLNGDRVLDDNYFLPFSFDDDYSHVSIEHCSEVLSNDGSIFPYNYNCFVSYTYSNNVAIFNHDLHGVFNYVLHEYYDSYIDDEGLTRSLMSRLLNIPILTVESIDDSFYSLMESEINKILNNKIIEKIYI